MDRFVSGLGLLQIELCMCTFLRRHISVPLGEMPRGATGGSCVDSVAKPLSQVATPLYAHQQWMGTMLTRILAGTLPGKVCLSRF